MDTKLEKLSKFLSLVLRHKPEAIGIELDNEGFTSLEDLIRRIRKVKGFSWVTGKDIIEIVKNDRKGRYELLERQGKTLIRARYGHSAYLDIRIDYPEVKADEVEFLYHGTNSKVLPWILKEGLKPMNRKYVHLSPTPEEAIIVAQRRKGKNVILKIEAKKYIEDGGKIWKATDKVFLAKEIPPRYIRIHKYGD